MSQAQEEMIFLRKYSRKILKKRKEISVIVIKNKTYENSVPNHNNITVDDILNSIGNVVNSEINCGKQCITKQLIR